MRTKLFFFLALPFLLFAKELPLRLTEGSEYVYQYSLKYGDNNRTSQYTFTVLSVDEKGYAKIAYKPEGDIPPWCAYKEYRFFINQNRWIWITDESCFLLKLCSGHAQYLTQNAKQFFSPLENYSYYFLCSEELTENEQKLFFHREKSCLDREYRAEVVLDRADGMLLSCRYYSEGELTLEISRLDQSD